MSQGKQFESAPDAEAPSSRAISTERQMGWPVDGSVTTSRALPSREIDRILSNRSSRLDTAEQVAGVVANAPPRVALEATEEPNALVPQIVLYRAALDTAPGDQEPGTRISRAGHRIDERRRRPEDLNQIAGRVEHRDFADEIAGSGRSAIAAGGQQRIVAIDRLGVAWRLPMGWSAQAIGRASP